MRRSLPALALIAVVVALWALVGGAGDHDFKLEAEFSNARGLTEGNDVRVGGAIAGRVEQIDLTDRGTALVRASLHDGLRPLRRDATAVIRPKDLLGDVYLSLSPGSDPEPLRGRIRPARTSNAPRIDELLAAFDEPTRSGLRALLVEGGIALEGRGRDLGAAAVELRPALAAADRVTRELGSQNAALGDLVANAEHAVGQLAGRRGDVGALLAELDAVLGNTAAHRTALDRGLQGLPSFLRRASRTSGLLHLTADAATPVAEDLRASAPTLSAAIVRLGPFLDGLRGASGRLRPTVSLLLRTLRDGRPALAGLDSGLRQLGISAPPLRRLLDVVVPAAPAFSEGFFVNFPDQAAEPGNQPFDPFADPKRNYWRGAAVLSCEAFGLRIEPGCFQQIKVASKGSKPAVQRTRTASFKAPARSSALLDYLLQP